MTPEATWMIATYLGMGVALGAGRRRTTRQWKQAARAAWCAMWFAGLVRCADATDLAGAARALDPAWASGPAAWTLAAAFVGRRDREMIGNVLRAALIATSVAALTLSRRPLDALAFLTSVSFGAAVLSAMRARRHLRLRLVAYWGSFIGTFAVSLPVLLAAHLPPAPRTRLCAVFAVAIAAVAAAIATAGTRAFAAAGGTPEPNDPPPTLCTTGIYAHLRHPIALAEVLAVLAGVLFVEPRAIAYAAVFAATILGPMRLLEERRLRERFGAGFDAYRAAVPAFLPRRASQRLAPAARGMPRPRHDTSVL